MAKINQTGAPENMRLADLVLLLENPELTPREREAIRKALIRLDSAVSIIGGGSGGTSIWQYAKLKNEIWHWKADGSDIDTYPNSSDGLIDCLNISVAGDKINVPQDIEVDKGITIPANVHLIGMSKHETVLSFEKVDTGAAVTLGSGATISNIGLYCDRSNYSHMITVAADAALENCDISYAINDATFHYVLNNPSTGDAYLRDCQVRAVQSGAGNIAIVRIESNTGDVVALNCELYCTSASGLGFIVHKYDSSADGFLRMYDGNLYASYQATNF